LLTKISGINMLDAAAKERWGDDEDYQEYRRKTSKLIPLPPMD
jgi:steroid 5-alpha reductase family enzyme